VGVTPPAQLGRYRIEEELGRGMMGVVYRAHDPALGRDVALKTVQLAFAIAPDQRESFEQRFIAEARAAAALSHPGIVVVHDVGRDPATGSPYIALEYLRGRTLSDRLVEGPLPVAEALGIAAQLAEALHHAHERGIVHRDIKPANIMLLDSGAAKVMDFGVAKVPASQLTAAGEFFGTPSYMSPEQALGETVDGRSDIFSLGCVLYAMLTGERAFDAPTVPTILAMIAHKDAALPSQRRAGLSRDVDAIVWRALAKSPDRRYLDGRTLAQDLRDAAEGRTPRHAKPAEGTPAAIVDRTVAGRAASGITPSPSPAPPPSAPADRRTVMVLGTVFILLLAAAAGWILMPGGLRARLVSTALPVPPPAEIAFTVDHSLKSGTVRVFVDDALEIEEALEGRVVQRILSVEIRKGTLEKTLYVPAGEHVLRVQVEGDTFSISRRLTTTIESGSRRRLRAEVGGLLKKELTLYWRD